MARLKSFSTDPGRNLKYLMIMAFFAALCYVGNRWFILPQNNIPSFFSEYFGDVLALPVYIPLSLYLARQLDVIHENYQLTVQHIIGAAILFAIIFEGFMPIVDESSTRDLWDIPAYLLGGVLVYIVNRLTRVSNM